MPGTGCRPADGAECFVYHGQYCPQRTVAARPLRVASLRLEESKTQHKNFIQDTNPQRPGGPARSRQAAHHTLRLTASTAPGRRHVFEAPAALDAARRLVVHHVLGCGRELGVSLDHLVDRLEHVFLCDLLAARTDRIHPCLSAHRAEIGTSAIGAQPRK